jgi:hypothetical protein
MRDLFELNINEGGKSVGRPAPTKELVREFEVKFAIKLPEDYRAENLWRETVHWRPNLGQKAVPFAENGGGDQFFLDLSTSPPL